ncbi:pol poly [Pelobates cultripes]|uniref:ribonuclease H n=1 Tax=Pelobates cultripes TaxID=61616 RepID=A0AAD1RF45_PELCU|nr:pol poly [Pelobates cultripes]
MSLQMIEQLQVSFNLQASLIDTLQLEDYRTQAQNAAHTAGFLQDKVHNLESKNIILDQAVDTLQCLRTKHSPSFKLGELPIEFSKTNLVPCNPITRGPQLEANKVLSDDKLKEISAHHARIEKEYNDMEMTLHNVKQSFSQEHQQRRDLEAELSEAARLLTETKTNLERFRLDNDELQRVNDKLKATTKKQEKTTSILHDTTQDLKTANKQLQSDLKEAKTKQHVVISDPVNVHMIAPSSVKATEARAVLSEIGQAPVNKVTIEDFSRFTHWIGKLLRWGSSDSQLKEIFLKGLGSCSAVIEGFAQTFSQLLEWCCYKLFHLSSPFQINKAFISLPNESITETANRVIVFLAALTNGVTSSEKRSEIQADLKLDPAVRELIFTLVQSNISHVMTICYGDLRNVDFNSWLDHLQVEMDRYSKPSLISEITYQAQRSWRDGQQLNNASNTWQTEGPQYRGRGGFRGRFNTRRGIGKDGSNLPPVHIVYPHEDVGAVKGIKIKHPPAHPVDTESWWHEYADVWAKDSLNCGKSQLMVSLDGSHHPYVKQYPIPREAEKDLEVIIDQLLQRGFIRPCQTAGPSPVWPIRKKDNTWRLTIDYRRLYETVFRSTPVVASYPELIAKLTPEMQYYTVLDLANLFYSVQVTPETQYRTAFSFQSKQYCWTVLPQGYYDSPAIFHSTSSKVS